jgi:hypothetical protein
MLAVMAMFSTGLIEMFFVARLGTDALTGIALVLPGLVLMQSMSQGAMGGGIYFLPNGHCDWSQSPAALQEHALVTAGLPTARERDRATARFDDR